MKKFFRRAASRSAKRKGTDSEEDSFNTTDNGQVVNVSPKKDSKKGQSCSYESDQSIINIDSRGEEPEDMTYPEVTGVGAENVSRENRLAERKRNREREREEEKKRQNSIPKGRQRSKYKTYILSDAVFEVESRFEIKEIIGHGAYGVVCSATDLRSSQLVAVKKVENIFEHRSLSKRTLRELKLIRCFFHENIMSVERVMRPSTEQYSNIYIVSELMETDLACVIRSPQELTDEHCQFFIYQVLRGLKYMHSANVMHRDLKPRNLLVNSNCDLKICDFGLARVDDPGQRDKAVMSNYIATRWYRAPEVILNRKPYTKAVDLWSVGCILAELIGRKPLFPGRDSFHQISLIISIIGSPDVDKCKDFVTALPKQPKVPFSRVYPNGNPLAYDLLDKLLQFEPSDRYTVEEALSHPYLEELHCVEDEPLCDTLDPTEFFFDHVRLPKEELKNLITREILNNYKEDTYVCKDEEQTFGDGFYEQMMSSLPKSKSGKHVRRKSF